MAEEDTSGGTSSLRGRAAGEIAVAEFLRVQEKTVPRSMIARVFGATVLTDESRPLYFDVIGQLAVAEALDALGDDWTVLHAIPVEAPEGAVDHVVIGPGGVFTLSSSYHARQSVSVAERRLHVAGARLDHIRDTEFDIGRVERRITAAAGRPTRVVGVIVVIDPRSLTVHDVPRDVAVVHSDGLAVWLRTRPACLDPECITAVVEVAERPSTWTVPDSLPLRGESLVRRFDVVRREVGTASAVQRLWLVGVSLALVGILAVAAWGVLLRATAG